MKEKANGKKPVNGAAYRLSPKELEVANSLLQEREELQTLIKDVGLRSPGSKIGVHFHDSRTCRWSLRGDHVDAFMSAVVKASKARIKEIETALAPVVSFNEPKPAKQGKGETAATGDVAGSA